MGRVKPYGLKQAQALVKDAVVRAKPRHDVWRALELLYRKGEAVEKLEAHQVPDDLWAMDGLTLDGINMVLPNVQILLQSAMGHDPEFLVEPWTGGDQAEQEAKTGEELLRYFWRRARGTDVHRSMVQDMVVLGNGFCKVGWSFLEELVERDDDELIDELVDLSAAEEQAADLEEREPRSVSALASQLELTEPTVVQDEPVIEYVSPFDILVPRHARRLDECRWIAQRVVLPIDEIEANPAFSDEAKEGLQPTFTEEDRPGSRTSDEGNEVGEGFGGDDDPFAEATVFEFYDMRTRRMLVFQESAATALYDDELPYGHRHPPFVHLRNFEDGGARFWSFGDVENVAAVQEEFNQYVHEQMSNARRAGNKYAVDDKAYDEDVRKLLESDRSDIAVPLRLGNRNIGDVIQALERQPADPETFQAKNDLVGHMHDVMGINAIQAGAGLGDRASATEAAAMDGTASLRAGDKRYQVEDAAAETGLRMLLLCQEHLDEEMALRIVGPEGRPAWLDVSREDLSGEFGVRVNSGSTQAVNPATRMQRALEVMTEIIPALQEDGYDTHPMWRQALRDYGMDPDRLLQKLPEPPAGGPPSEGGELEQTVPQEGMGGPPVPAATAGDVAL